MCFFSFESCDLSIHLSLSRFLCSQRTFFRYCGSAKTKGLSLEETDLLYREFEYVFFSLLNLMLSVHFWLSTFFLLSMDFFLRYFCFPQTKGLSLEQMGLNTVNL